MSAPFEVRPQATSRSASIGLPQMPPPEPFAQTRRVTIWLFVAGNVLAILAIVIYAFRSQGISPCGNAPVSFRGGKAWAELGLQQEQGDDLVHPRCIGSKQKSVDYPPSGPVIYLRSPYQKLWQTFPIHLRSRNVFPRGISKDRYRSESRRPHQGLPRTPVRTSH